MRPLRSKIVLALFAVSLSTAIALEETVGEPWEGAEAIRNTTANLMFEQHSRGADTRELRRHPRFVRQFDSLRANPGSPSVSTWPPENSGLIGDNPQAPQTAAVNFTGATLTDTRAFPPDSMGAVGPAQFIVAVNGRIRSFTKSGASDGVLNVDTDVFFASVMTPSTTGNFTSDPRIRYDRLSRRWFIIIIDVPGNPPGALANRVMIAMSDGPIITSGTVWSFFQFQGDATKFADYPTLGIDANALYIGVNIFATRGSGSFDNTTAFVVRKSSLLSGGPIVVTTFAKLVSNNPNASGPYTPQGVDNYDPNATEGYIIGVDAKYFGKLQLRRISNPGGTPSMSSSTITIPLNGSTMTVPHLGNTGGANGNLDGLDYRLLAAHVRNGRLWTAENVAVDNAGNSSAAGATVTRNAVRWYELDGIATGQTPSVRQSGTLFQPSASNTTDQRHYWMGTIMVSGQGHAALGFSVAGANERINAATAGRLATDPLGTLQTPVLYTATASSYNPPSDSGGSQGRRWGDYSYTSLDPNDDMTMWTIQEFCDSTDSYAVRIAQLLAPPPATPVACSPSSIAIGANNVSVTVTGLVVSGSGFFDPGAGFSNRLAAAVNGYGVTVTSVTYNNPSNFVLHVNVSASANAGGRSLTITNPDGQSITSVDNLLTITGTSISNSPPSLAAISSVTIDEQALFTFTASANDTNGDALTFSLTSSLPGPTIDATSGLFTWTPTEAQGPGTNNISIVVTDNGTPSLSATQNFTLIVREVNRPPEFSSASSRIINELTTLLTTNAATDPDLPANTLQYSLLQAPAGMTINSNTAVIQWTPAEDQGPSTNFISLLVTDNGTPPLSATQTFTVFVQEVNTAPLLGAISNRVLYAGETLSLSASATDADLPANELSFTLEPDAPAGANITSAGNFTWTPTNSDLGTHIVNVRVTDTGVPPMSDLISFDVTVLAAPSIEGISLDATNVTLRWTAVPDRTYRVQFKQSVTDAAWNDLPGDITAVGTSTQKADAIVDAQRFYRLMVLP